MDQDNVLVENELLDGSERSALDLPGSSTNCRTPTPEFDTNFIAWRNPSITIDEEDSVAGPPSPVQSDHYESPEQSADTFQRDLDFIKRYALDAEPDVLFSLLKSEADNPNRLEFIMQDLLGLPNVPQLIQEYKKSNYKPGDKRSSSDQSSEEPIDMKKRKITIAEPLLNSPMILDEPEASSSKDITSHNGESSSSLPNQLVNGESSNSGKEEGRNQEPEVEGDAKNEFLDLLKDMFPDADGLFLISESQHLKDQDDCSRFIQTVMLSGLYPKKGDKDDSWKRPAQWDSDDDISEIPNNKSYRSVFINSDDESIDNNDPDEEAPIVVKRKIMKVNEGPPPVIEKEITVIDLGKESVKIKETTSAGPSSAIQDEPMMTISDDSNSTETYSPNVAANVEFNNFDQTMADELDIILNDLGIPNATPGPAPIPVATKPVANKPIPTATTVQRNVVVSSTLDDSKKAESDALDLIFDAPGPSISVPKGEVKKIIIPNVKINTFKIPVIENGVSLDPIAAKETSPSKGKLPSGKQKNFIATKPKILNLENQDEDMNIDNETPSPTVFAQPDGLKLVIKMPKSESSSSTSTVVSSSSKTATATVTKLPKSETNANMSAGSNLPMPVTSTSAKPGTSTAVKSETAMPGPSGVNASRKTSPSSSSAKAETEEIVETEAAATEVKPTAEEEKAAKESKWVEEQTSNLIRIFPGSDPEFLKAECAKMECSENALNEFVLAKLENNDMPTRAEYEKRIEMEELQNRYTKNFVIQDFLKAVPDPWTYFSDVKRNCTKYKMHSLCYLKTSFRKHLVKDINDALTKNNFNLYLAYQHLSKNVTRQRCGKRTDFECSNSRPTTIDIQFLQEVAFIENESKIKNYLEAQRLEKEAKFNEARLTNSLLECQCCFDNEVLVEDTVYCPDDHNFCKSCVIRSVEVEMGNGRHEFRCLANCESKFTLASLQGVLKPEVFSKVIQAIQMEEIKAAGIEDLVQCPFCSYATILPPEEKVMTCLNPECLKESCRSCKELNHIPLRCNEVEKSEDVKLRTYIENKMTEALVRTCYKCNKKFVKEDGCNKMTCTCGARMCYVCRQPVTDYSHFNGQGGTDFSKCPLYSTNDELHVDAVKKVAEEAKKEVLKGNPEKKLVHDPTAILPQRRNDTPMPGMARAADLLNLAGMLRPPNRPAHGRAVQAPNIPPPLPAHVPRVHVAPRVIPGFVAPPAVPNHYAPHGQNMFQNDYADLYRELDDMLNNVPRQPPVQPAAPPMAHQRNQPYQNQPHFNYNRPIQDPLELARLQQEQARLQVEQARAQFEQAQRLPQALIAANQRRHHHLARRDRHHGRHRNPPGHQ